MASKADCLSLQYINEETMAEFYHNMVPWFIFVSFKEIFHSLLIMRVIYAHCRKTGKEKGSSIILPQKGIQLSFWQMSSNIFLYIVFILPTLDVTVKAN